MEQTENPARKVIDDGIISNVNGKNEFQNALANSFHTF